jgi:hypothetical protein
MGNHLARRRLALSAPCHQQRGLWMRWVSKGVVEIGAVNEEIRQFVTLALGLKEEKRILSKANVMQPTPIALSEIILDQVHDHPPLSRCCHNHSMFFEGYKIVPIIVLVL